MDLGVTPMKYYESHFLQNAKKNERTNYSVQQFVSSRNEVR